MARGKYGRRPPKNAPALRASQFLTGVIPDHPAAADWIAKLAGGWVMLGNDAAGNCVSPETRVLTADLRWIPAGDLLVGDHLVGFDEESPDAWKPDGKRSGRQYRRAVVERTDRVMRPCYDLVFDDGTRVRSSAGHKWLVGAPGQKAARWVTTENLMLTESRASQVVKPLGVWDTDTSREAGYLAAAFDGEGNIDQHRDSRHQGGSNRLAFAQVDNEMLAETERCLKALGFDYGHTTQVPGPNQEVTPAGNRRQELHRLTVDRRGQMMRFLGSVRPARLLPKFNPDVLGRLNVNHTARLVSKTAVGEQEVVMLDTTARTYIAEGLASHNCVGVTWATIRRILSALLGGREVYPSQDLVWAVYQTQNPGFDPDGSPDTNGPGSEHDGGMDIQTLLEFLHANPGMFDGGELIAFAKVDPANTDEIEAAIAIGGTLWTGLVVTAANEEQADEGQDWDYAAGSKEAGGHSVTAAGYGPQARSKTALSGRVRIETWAMETSFTDALISHQVEEMWMTIWRENTGTTQFQQGVDTDALKAAYQELTGRVLVIPDIPPPPAPGPLTAAQELWSVAGPWCSHNRTRPDLVTLKAALETFAEAEGLS